jgi:hypothetical protein
MFSESELKQFVSNQLISLTSRENGRDIDWHLVLQSNVSNQLISLTSREPLWFYPFLGSSEVSNQLISLTSRELLNREWKPSEKMLQVSNQLISLTSRELNLVNPTK